MSENESVNKKSRKNINKKNKKKILRIILISILGVLAILIAVGFGYYKHIKNKVYIESKTTNPTTEEVKYEEVDGITNVLLIGTDGRTLDEPARSDSIIVATLDNNNKKVKLTTIMRDTLVDIPEYGENKINAAFAFGSSELDEDGEMRGAEGGASLLMQTIQENFDLHLDKYIIVNFWGFEDIIDKIGGIEADIKDYEIDEVNKYIGEATGVKSEPLTETGWQTLNGQQALSYARIRYVGNGNFERGERQSKVLFQIATKLKEVNPLKYVSIANTLAEQVKTNIPIPEALDLAYTIYKLPSLDFEQLQIPQTELIARDNLYKDRGWCLLIDLKQNAQVMHDFIFNNKTPNPDEFDLVSVANVAAAYDAEEARYNSRYNIKPEDYNDRNQVETPKPLPNQNNQGQSQDGNTGNNNSQSGSGSTGNNNSQSGSGSTGNNNSQSGSGSAGNNNSQSGNGNTGSNNSQSESGNTGNNNSQSGNGDTGNNNSQSGSGNTGSVEQVPPSTGGTGNNTSQQNSQSTQNKPDSDSKPSVQNNSGNEEKPKVP